MKEKIKKLLDKTRILPTDNIPEPEPVWIQQTENKETILGTLGNFSMVVGKAKSRKTFYLTIALSTIVKNDFLFNQFKGVLPDNQRNVLYFDTEQGKYHAQLALKRICTKIGISEPENLQVFTLRSLGYQERLEFIEEIINETENLGLVVIDGCRDLVSSINDEEQATKIASKFLKWTEEKNMHLITVLHENKKDNNARGHLGSELLNKAETVFSVQKDEKNKNVSFVKAEYCRGLEPENFAFEVIDFEDNVSLPSIINDYEITSTGVKLSDIEDQDLFEIISLALENRGARGLKYLELVKAIQNSYSKFFKKDRTIGLNTAKQILSKAKESNLITQKENKGEYNLAKKHKPIESLF